MGNVERKFPGFEIQMTTSDFNLYCHSEKLVIEIDGSIHDSKESKIKDGERQKDLESLGLLVIRFKNNDILNKLDTVLKIIENNLKK